MHDTSINVDVNISKDSLQKIARDIQQALEGSITDTISDAITSGSNRVHKKRVIPKSIGANQTVLGDPITEVTKKELISNIRSQTHKSIKSTKDTVKRNTQVSLDIFSAADESVSKSNNALTKVVSASKELNETVELLKESSDNNITAADIIHDSIKTIKSKVSKHRSNRHKVSASNSALIEKDNVDKTTDIVKDDVNKNTSTTKETVKQEPKKQVNSDPLIDIDYVKGTVGVVKEDSDKQKEEPAATDKPKRKKRKSTKNNSKKTNVDESSDIVKEEINKKTEETKDIVKPDEDIPVVNNKQVVDTKEFVLPQSFEPSNEPLYITPERAGIVDPSESINVGLSNDGRQEKPKSKGRERDKGNKHLSETLDIFLDDIDDVKEDIKEFQDIEKNLEDEVTDKQNSSEDTIKTAADDIKSIKETVTSDSFKPDPSTSINLSDDRKPKRGRSDGRKKKKKDDERKPATENDLFNFEGELTKAKIKLFLKSRILAPIKEIRQGVLEELPKSQGAAKKAIIKRLASGPLLAVTFLMDAVETGIHTVLQQILQASTTIFGIARKIVFKPALEIVKTFASILKQAVSQSQMLQSIMQLVIVPFTLMLEYILMPVIKELTPIITSLVNGISHNKDAFVKWGEVLASIVKDVIEPSLELLEKNFLKNPLQGLFDMFDGISSKFRDWFVERIGKITDLLSNAAVSGSKFLAHSMEVAAVIAKAISTAILYAVNSPEWKEVYPVMVESFKSILDSVRDVLTSAPIKKAMADLVGIFIGNLTETAIELITGNKSDRMQERMHEIGSPASAALDPVVNQQQGFLDMAGIFKKIGQLLGPLGLPFYAAGATASSVVENKQEQYINNNYNNTTVSSYQEGAYII